MMHCSHDALLPACAPNATQVLLCCKGARAHAAPTRVRTVHRPLAATYGDFWCACLRVQGRLRNPTSFFSPVIPPFGAPHMHSRPDLLSPTHRIIYHAALLLTVLRLSRCPGGSVQTTPDVPRKAASIASPSAQTTSGCSESQSGRCDEEKLVPSKRAAAAGPQAVQSSNEQRRETAPRMLLFNSCGNNRAPFPFSSRMACSLARNQKGHGRFRCKFP